jgi:hypothetical protein
LPSFTEGCHSCSDLDIVITSGKPKGSLALSASRALNFELQCRITFPHTKDTYNLIMVKTILSIFQLTVTTLITVAIGIEFGQPF